MAIHVEPTADAAAGALARWLATYARRCSDERGRVDIALPGGRTPLPLFAALAAGLPRDTIDWRRMHLWPADERLVPRADPARNDELIAERLVAPVHMPAAQLHRVPDDPDDPERAARAYEDVLPSPLDLVVLGLGEDGHVASLFPGSPLLGEERRRVAVARDCPKPPPLRVTLTPAALREARAVAVLATGRAKAEAVARALGGAAPAQVPAALLRGRDWWLDAAAASRLGPPHPREEGAGGEDEHGGDHEPGRSDR